MDVGAWLRDLGLAQYEALFRDNEIEADVLVDLTESDLEKIGLPLGPRKRVLKAIANLDTTVASSSPVVIAGSVFAATCDDAAKCCERVAHHVSQQNSARFRVSSCHWLIW